MASFKRKLRRAQREWEKQQILKRLRNKSSTVVTVDEDMKVSRGFMGVDLGKEKR